MIAVITGASQGIGRAVALTLAEEPDARLALWARTTSQLEATADACRERGAAALVQPTDVTDEAAVRNSAREVLNRWDAPHVLVNNAGTFEPGLLSETTTAAFRDQVEVNLTSAFTVTSAFLEPMQDKKRGHVFFMASVASIKGYPNGGAYGPAKHGLLGLARTLREETTETNLRVTALLPGATYTASWQQSDLPAERFMKPDDVAQTVREVYHLSERAVVEEVLLRPQRGDV